MFTEWLTTIREHWRTIPIEGAVQEKMKDAVRRGLEKTTNIS